jgi:hypothetical protein
MTSAHDGGVDIVIPVHIEEVDLARSVRRLDAFLAEHFPYRYAITMPHNPACPVNPATPSSCRHP